MYYNVTCWLLLQNNGNMKILTKTLLCSILISGLSGCATTRGLVSLESPEKPVSSSVAVQKIAVINMVDDIRVFEDKPKQANIPSLKGGLEKATELEKSKAIARKRNGYGKAMGDILLKDETVSSVLQKRVEAALLKSGYTIIPASQVSKPDLVLNVKVEKFWSWMQPGFSYITLNTEIETEIQNTNDPDKIIHTYSKISKPTAMASGSRWIKTINEALHDYENRLTDQLK